ncbi:GRB2-associated-binding protein 2 [Sciurus carolinensis]|uniref:GRB2-associated-binding protein 2 n=1 Tax=Sciurus carolinensis TaxID=30640 RepID=A0AA41SX03_SCICA|nr:GRB2-associated-binding protein 2 [Sciurus carolinensis]
MLFKSHTRGSPTGSKTDNDDPYIFMAHTKTPLSDFKIPKTSIMDKSQSTLVAAAPGNKAMATPYHAHKPNPVETPPQIYPSQDSVVRKKGRSVSFAVTMAWHRLLCSGQQPLSPRSVLTPAKVRGEEAFFPETCKHSPRGTESEVPSTESRSLGDNFYQALCCVLYALHTALRARAVGYCSETKAQNYSTETTAQSP